MDHPGILLQQELTARGLTQKAFATLIGKKISEVNELIKGKRNITVQRDILLSAVFGDVEQKRLQRQNDYDYSIAKAAMQSKLQEFQTKRILPSSSAPVSAPLQQSAPQIPAPSSTKDKAHEVFQDF